MKAPEISSYEWQQRNKTVAACLVQLPQLHWSKGFQCPHSGHDRGDYTRSHRHKDRRSNRCFPSTGEAAEPYLGEERVEIRAEPGGILSSKPSDDRRGEAAMLNAAICAAFGVRTGVPDPRRLGRGWVEE